MDLKIPEMSCGHRKAAIEHAILAADPAAVIVVDLAQRQASIQSPQPVDALQEVLRRAGYASELLLR